MLTRREYLKFSAMATIATQLRAQTKPDHTLTIAPYSLEYKPNRFIKTIAYNNQVPGPLLNLVEGRPITIEVINKSSNPELVHWHGLHIPANVDGAMEEGTPMIKPGASARYTFTPSPAGLRWYHTHTFAGTNTHKAAYTGQHGMMIIRNMVTAYAATNVIDLSREIFLTLEDWNAQFLPSDDGSLMPTYDLSTINGRTLGFGEPIRVTSGERILLHILNASPTEVHYLTLAGHQFQVIALDGNSVPTPRPVPQLRLAPAERVTAIVEMNNPGIWALGEVRKHIRDAGMGIAIEYANATGTAQWQQPSAFIWNYLDFAAPAAKPPDSNILNIPLSFDSKFRGHGSEEQWLINGRSWPSTNPTKLKTGQRYRLQFTNDSSDDHPVHLHRHSFEIRRIGNTLCSGIVKDVILVPNETVEVEFTADNPGPTLFHCHQQNHMDLGFMTLFNYESFG